MMRALYSGVAGLRTHQTRMDVIGNNIANVNTLAFKSSSTTFQDIMYQTTSGASGPTENLGGKNANQIGLGVTTGATKISIESGGSAESTGEGTDIKLTDAQNTNFFIVNNGAENVFTRAGSFYVDKAGNLAMTTTGYLVQGWGIDPETLDIRQDSVQPLRVMSEANRTSEPEATTLGSVSGVLDKNTPAISSENGYIMSLEFYDQMGFTYNAKFSVRAVDTKSGEYAVSLKGITDASGVDVLNGANNQSGLTITPDNMEQIFGADTQRASAYTLVENKFFYHAPTGGTATTGTVTTTAVNKTTGMQVTYTLDLATAGDPAPQAGSTEPLGYMFTGSDGSSQFFSLSDMYGVDNNIVTQRAATLTNTTLSVDNQPVTQTLQFTNGKLVLVRDTTDFTLKFSPEDGSFSYVGEDGSRNVMLNLEPLGEAFENISIDFTQVKCADNNKASTLGMEKGDVSRTLGTGKKLGNMTGLSIDQSGKIFGTYDNGNTVLLGQIAVAQFANPSGLESLGNNCYATTLNSGEFDGIGVQVTADGGKMTTGQLEMSNVDLAREFTTMITTQRGFQANSRIITVSDTLLEELVNLKR